MTYALKLSKIFNLQDLQAFFWVGHGNTTPATDPYAVKVAEMNAILAEAAAELKRTQVNNKSFKAAALKAFDKATRDIEQNIKDEKAARAPVQTNPAEAKPAPVEKPSPASQLMPQRKA